MVEIGITRMSSKGQIVIPLEMRGKIREGEKLLVLGEGDKLIIRKATEMDEQLKEDLEFAKRTEEAWKRIDRGEGIRMDADVFLDEMMKW